MDDISYFIILDVSINMRIIKFFVTEDVTEKAHKQYLNVALNKSLILILQKNNCHK